MDAVQSGLGKNDLGHQVILLTKEIEELKEKHRYHHNNICNILANPNSLGDYS